MGRSVRRLTGLSAVAAVLAAIPAAAAAVEPLDTFSVSIGGYVTRFDTRVRADGELLACQPATELPLAQRYFLF